MLMSQHKAPHGKWEPALRHLSALDDAEIPEPKTLFDDYAGRTSSAREHKMGILEHLGDGRLMLKYSSQFTPEQFKVFDGYFRPRNESFLAKRDSMSKEELTRWHYQRWIRNYLLWRQGGGRERRALAQILGRQRTGGEHGGDLFLRPRVLPPRRPRLVRQALDVRALLPHASPCPLAGNREATVEKP